MLYFDQCSCMQAINLCFLASWGPAKCVLHSSRLLYVCVTHKVLEDARNKAHIVQMGLVCIKFSIVMMVFIMSSVLYISGINEIIT